MANIKQTSVKNNRQRRNTPSAKRQSAKYDEPIATKDMIIITVVIAILILCFTTIKLVEYNGTYYMCIRIPVQPNEGATVLFEHTHTTREYLIETNFNPETERESCTTIWGIALFSFGN